MGRGLFITGTDTDVGKTYVTALLVKTLRSAGYDVGYYKAAISGARTVEESDAGFVNRLRRSVSLRICSFRTCIRMPYRPIWQQELKGIPWRRMSL